MATNGCATCSDLTALTRTVNQIRDGQVAQIREMGIIVQQNRLILAELAGIAGAVGVGVAADKLGKILAVVSTVASVISSIFSIYAGLGKGELKKLLVETKKKANDAQYAATQASIKSDKILEQSLLAEAGSIIRDAEIRKLSNDSLYASTQTSIKSDGINKNIVQLSKNQNENLTTISNDIVQVSDNLNNNLQLIFNKLPNNTSSTATRQIIKEVFREVPSEVRRATEPLVKQVQKIGETANDDRKINNPIVRKIPDLIKAVGKSNPPLSQYQPKKIADDIKENVVTSLRGINWSDLGPKVIYPDLEPIIAKHIDGSFSAYVQPDVRNIGDTQERINKKVEEITSKLTQQEKESRQVSPNVIAEMKKLLNPQKESSGEPLTKTDLDSVNNKLKEITSLITPLPALVEGLNPTKNQEIFNKISDAAATGVCRTTQPGGCMGKALSNLGDKNAQGLSNLGSKLDAANLASNAAQLALLNKIDKTTVANGVKLGEQLANGGIGGKLARLGDMLKLPQILAVTNFAVSVHNALMLSNDIGQTLGGIIDTAIRVAVPKDSELASINVTEIIGKQFSAWLIDIIGAQNYAELSINFAKANRIYQAGSNLLYSVQSLNDSVLTVSESIFGNVSLIGNALKKARVINDGGYDWMSPNMSAQFRWAKRLENLDEAAGFLALIVGSIASGKDAIDDTKANKEELDKALVEARKPITEKQTKEKIASLTDDGIIEESWDVGSIE